MAIDFSGLNRIAYKGFEDEPGRRDELIEQGFSLTDEQTPFDAPSASGGNDTGEGGQASPSEYTHTHTHVYTHIHTHTHNPAERITDHTGRRDYLEIFRAAYEYLKRNSPPLTDASYWRDHRPGADFPPDAELDYWVQVARDAVATTIRGDGDPFLMDLIDAVQDELEREYNQLRAEAAG